MRGAAEPAPGPVGVLTRRSERLARVEEEIRRAQAEALGRSGERLQALLDGVAAWDRCLDDAWQGSPLDMARLLRDLAARNRLRDEAARVRLHLVIQREALGLACHVAVERCYPVPERRRPPADTIGGEGGGAPCQRIA